LIEDLERTEETWWYAKITVQSIGLSDLIQASPITTLTKAVTIWGISGVRYVRYTLNGPGQGVHVVPEEIDYKLTPIITFTGKHPDPYKTHLYIRTKILVGITPLLSTKRIDF
jgi:hypothetical protein